VKAESAQNTLHPELAKALGTYGEQASEALPDLERIARCEDCDRIVRLHAFSALISIGGFEYPVFQDENLDAPGRRCRFSAYTASWMMFRNQHPNVDAERLEAWATRGFALADDLVARDQAQLDRGFLESMGQIYWALGFLPRSGERTEELYSRWTGILGQLCKSAEDAELREAACRGREEVAQLQEPVPRDAE